jgi:ABC-2 type transport system permease protein
MTTPQAADGTAGPTGASGAGGPTGSIYDLGYRGYTGPRLGRSHAVRSLIGHSFRSAYGLGRGGRAKIAPITFGAMALLPAVALVGILTIASRFGERVEELLTGQAPIGYDSYFSLMTIPMILFCAAQAPELFGRDQRHGVLSLYFARALRRSDYAIARLAGFIVALAVLQLLPNLVMFLGRVLVSPDIVDGFRREADAIPPVLAQICLSSALMGGLAMVVSAFTPRRAYATAGIIALFLIPSIVAGVVTGLGSSGIGPWLILLSPTSALDGTNAVLFDISLGQEFFFVDLPDWAYFAAVFAGIAGSLIISIRRFVRIAT